jgi:hypothetical protein
MTAFTANSSRARFLRTSAPNTVDGIEKISRLRHVGNAPALSILSTVLAAAPLRQTAASV